MKKKPRPQLFRPFRYLKNYLFSAFVSLILGYAFWINGDLNNIRLPESGMPAELYANQNSDDLTKTFTAAIDSAEHSVLLMIYSLTDPKIISSLKQKSQQGIEVRVICDAKASPYADSKLGSKVTTIRRFGPGLMHQKILVIDEHKTWLGSANMTTESLRMHGNLVMAMDDPILAGAIMNKARTMKVEGHDLAFPFQYFNIGGQKAELWFLPDNKNAIDRLKTLIQGAKKTVRVAMFTWTRQDLAQEIIAASKRGIQTEVVIDHYAGKGASAKIVKLLKKNNIAVNLSRGGPLLHHKFLYIDGKTLVNGSANWTKAAFTQNDDCFMVLHDLTTPQKESMEMLWHTIRAESVAVPAE